MKADEKEAHYTEVIDEQKKLINMLEKRWEEQTNPPPHLDDDEHIDGDCDCIDELDLQKLRDRLELLYTRAIVAGCSVV